MVLPAGVIRSRVPDTRAPKASRQGSLGAGPHESQAMTKSVGNDYEP